MCSCSAAHTVMLIRNFLNSKKKEILNIASSADYTEYLLSLHTCIGQALFYLGRASRTGMYSLMITDNILNKATLRNQRKRLLICLMPDAHWHLWCDWSSQLAILRCVSPSLKQEARIPKAATETFITLYITKTQQIYYLVPHNTFSMLIRLYQSPKN